MTTVAAIQMTSSADVAGNLAEAGRLLGEARSRGALVTVLPENFAFMGISESDKFAIAEEQGVGPIQEFVASTARELGMWIVAGTIPLRIAGRAAPCRGVAGVRRPGPLRRALRQDPPVRRRDPGPGRALPGIIVGAARRRARVRGHAGRAPRPRGLLRPAFSRALPPAARDGRAVVLPAVGVHRADGPRALGSPAARAGDREPLPRGRAGAVRIPSRTAAKPTATR